MPCRLLTRLSAAILVTGGLFTIEACAPESASGEIVLLISTDLSVPTDVDTLNITVTRDGRQVRLSDRCYALGPLKPDMPVCQATSLPGTVALVFDDVRSGLVQVHLELRKGGAQGTVRVKRDAELQIPSEGVKQVPMRLDFLCLEARLPAPCAPGTTCQAGSCVDDKVGQLADFVAAPALAAPASDCFDVATCVGAITGANWIVPVKDEHLEQCALTGTKLLDAVHVNLTLVVNPAVVGNYGVCDSSSGKCLVPLDQGPGGWTTLSDSNGDAIAIGLPEAVCDAVAGKSVSGVVISPSAQCGVKRASVGLCPATPICVAADEICPEPWSGSSCSDDATPTTDSKRPGLCGQVKTDPETGPLVPGLWCCNESEPPPRDLPSRDPLLIDDMSSGPQIKLAPVNGNGAGAWFTFSDDRNAVISPPPYPALFTYREFEPPVVPTAGAKPISHAACLRSDGVAGYATGEGFDFLRATPKYDHTVPLDVSPYTGLRFWAYSAPPVPGKLDLPTTIRMQVASVDTRNQDADAPCHQPDGPPCDEYGKWLTLPNDGSWVRYTIKWTELEQQGFGLPFPWNPNLYVVAFEMIGNGGSSRSLPFDFCVAQLEFTQD